MGKHKEEAQFEVRCTGGKAAQILALMNAIYVSQKVGKSFYIRYFSGSTGTYWRFELQDLLDVDEAFEVVLPTGVRDEATLSHGSRILNFQRNLKLPSKISLYRWLEKRGLLAHVRNFRKEVSVSGYRDNLEKATKEIKILSGNFVPISDESVLIDLSRRRATCRGPNPFIRKAVSGYTSIHYRLGDMRNEPHRKLNEEESRVVDPTVFAEILMENGIDTKRERIRVLSDEPEIACHLLHEAGMRNLVSSSGASFWDDLNYMSEARMLIGSLSQMSVLGGMLCLRNGGSVIFPASAHGEGSLQEGLQLQGSKFYEFRFLQRNHEVFRF